MTKKVRIENADTSNYRVVVEVWTRGEDGEPERLVATHELANPAQLLEEYIHTTRCLVIKEASGG